MEKRTISKSQLDLLPAKASLEELREAANSCKACDLWKLGKQAVFGEGSSSSKIMLVGEQPGDQEDLVGRPFVGPAGKLLDSALVEAGIDRKKVYVTNAVKHFKWSHAARGASTKNLMRRKFRLVGLGWMPRSPRFAPK